MSKLFYLKVDPCEKGVNIIMLEWSPLHVHPYLFTLVGTELFNFLGLYLMIGQFAWAYLK